MEIYPPEIRKVIYILSIDPFQVFKTFCIRIDFFDNNIRKIILLIHYNVTHSRSDPVFYRKIFVNLSNYTARSQYYDIKSIII